MSKAAWPASPLFVAIALGCGGPASGQGIDLEVALDQAFTSVETLGSPTGLHLGVHAPRRWNRLGAQLNYRDVREDGGAISRYCGLFCVEGPFDRAYVLRTLSVGLTYAVLPGAPVELDVGLATSFSWQSEQLVRLDTGDASSRGSVGPDVGFGAFVDVRTRPLAYGLRPILYARYDRVSATSCVADASCFGGRHVASVGVGLAVQR